MSKTKPLTIVLPCYNPATGWAQNVVAHQQQIAEQLGTEVSIIVVNDGSKTGVTDDDIALLKQKLPYFNYIHYSENKGKGYAVRTGIAAAKTDIVIYTDIDFPYTVESLLKVYDALLNGNVDLAVGVKDEDYYNKVPAVRKFISKILRKLIGWFLRIPITDTQCGLKGLNTKKIIRETAFMNATINRYLFDLELIQAATKKGLSLKAIEVKLKEGVIFSKMNIKVLLPELFNFIKILLKR